MTFFCSLNGPPAEKLMLALCVEALEVEALLNGTLAPIKGFPHEWLSRSGSLTGINGVTPD